jgi:cell wall-associated NlpC family hydrolase
MSDLVESDDEEEDPVIVAKKTEEAKRTAGHAAEFEEYMASASALTQPARAASASTRTPTTPSMASASALTQPARAASASTRTPTTPTTGKTTATTVATTTTTPTGIRSLLDEMSEINDQQLRLAEVVLPNGEVHVAQAEVPRYVTMEVVLDSGAGAHVANKRHVPGYKVVPSALSKLGAAFVAADGGKIDNQGEALLSLITTDSRGAGHAVRANFQIADVTRALWSVGLICDSGLDVKFAAMSASIPDRSGKEICHFERRHGLYIATVQLENPLHESFGRPGPV